MGQKIHGNFYPEMYAVTQQCGDDTEYVFELLSKSQTGVCPNCGLESTKRHDYQARRVRDLPILGKPVRLVISQMKYYCENKECEVEIFTEQNELVSPYSQFTERCRKYMLKVATLVSCESAVKILAYQGIKVSGDTLLNMLKAAGKAYEVKPVRKIGVDDWAYRKGQRYGTIICDLETHKIIDVLEGRNSETLEKWLEGHPDIEIVSRDRSSAYSSAVSSVLPEAVQIADRFHITKNLLEALKDTMKAFMPEVVYVPKEETTQPELIQTNHAAKKTRPPLSVKNPKSDAGIK
jgi:transposase